jgi:hypothetical protein
LEVSKRPFGSVSALKELVRFIINWLTYPCKTIFLLTLIDVCFSYMVYNVCIQFFQCMMEGLGVNFLSLPAPVSTNSVQNDEVHAQVGGN